MYSIRNSIQIMNQYKIERVTRATEIALAIFGCLVYIYGLLLFAFYRPDEMTVHDPDDGLVIWHCRPGDTHSMTNPLIEMDAVEGTTMLSE